jgi:hypothetical protein
MTTALRVFKYQLPIEDYASVDLPIGAEILSVGYQFAQSNYLQVWARVDPKEMRIAKRRFRIAGTGHPEAVGVFIGTVMVRDLVFHVFHADADRSMSDDAIIELEVSRLADLELEAIRSEETEAGR